MWAMAAVARSAYGAPGEIEIAVRRDRQARFDPQLIQKHQTRFEGLEDTILALCAPGMTSREIQAQVQDLSGVQVSPAFISTLTQAVMQQVRQWQKRPLQALSALLSVDCLLVKGREKQRLLNRALSLALGVDMAGPKERLGMCFGQNEGATFCWSVFTELEHRGLKDLFLGCVDGLTGLPEAIEPLYPHTPVPLCMLHLVRHSLKEVSCKHRKEVAADVKLISWAATESQAQVSWDLFAEKGDRQEARISKMGRAHWLAVIPLFAFPEDIGKLICTTKATLVGQQVFPQSDPSSPPFSLR